MKAQRKLQENIWEYCTAVHYGSENGARAENTIPSSRLENTAANISSRHTSSLGLVGGLLQYSPRTLHLT